MLRTMTSPPPPPGIQKVAMSWPSYSIGEALNHFCKRTSRKWHYTFSIPRKAAFQPSLSFNLMVFSVAISYLTTIPIWPGSSRHRGRYSQICRKRPPLGARKSGRLRQMVSYGRCMVNQAYQVYASMYSNRRE